MRPRFASLLVASLLVCSAAVGPVAAADARLTLTDTTVTPATPTAGAPITAEATLLGVVAVVVTATRTQLPLWAVLMPGNALVPLGAFAFGILIALVGGLYPAYRAAWEPPVEALRG